MAMLRCLGLGAALVLAGLSPLRAEEPGVRAMRALSAALDVLDDAKAKQARLGVINAELLAILGERPDSAMARAILSPDPATGLSILQRVQAQLGVPVTKPPVTDPPAACRQEQVILDLSERILSQRMQVPGFGPANHGTDAAYLWLHYAKPEPAAGLQRLLSIAREGRRPPRRFDELMQSYAFTHLPPLEAAAVLGLKPWEVIATPGPAAAAALIARDDGKSYHRLLEEARRVPDMAPALADPLRLASSAATGLYHLDDLRKRAIAEEAEASGNLLLAALLLANRRDQGAYFALLSRWPGDPWLSRLRVDAYGGSVLTHAAPTPSGPGQDVTPMRPTQFDVFRAGLLMEEADFLNILLNQTGWEEDIALVARDFLAGRIGGGGLETTWLAVYDALAQRRGPGEMARAMNGFQMPGVVRHYAGPAQQMIDWMRALRALRPVLTTGAPPPPRPALLSPGFDWPRWVALAQQVGQSGVPAPASETEAQVIAELVLAARGPEAAIAFAQDGMSPGPRLDFFGDLARRLDRACGRHTLSPGQAILRGGQTPFVFPDTR